MTYSGDCKNQDASSLCDNMTNLTDTDLWAKLQASQLRYEQTPGPSRAPLRLTHVFSKMFILHCFTVFWLLDVISIDMASMCFQSKVFLGKTYTVSTFLVARAHTHTHTHIYISIQPPMFGEGPKEEPGFNQTALQAWDKEGYSIACGSRGNYQGIIAGETWWGNTCHQCSAAPTVSSCWF